MPTLGGGGDFSQYGGYGQYSGNEGTRKAKRDPFKFGQKGLPQYAYPGDPGFIGPVAPPGGGMIPQPNRTMTPQSLYAYWDQLLGPLAGDETHDYEVGYNQAMAGINQRYKNAMNILMNTQQKADAALGAMPGEYEEIYTEGDTSGAAGVNRAYDIAGETPEGYALPQDISAGGFDESVAAPFHAALAGMQSDRMADIPMLDLGTTQFINTQRAGLEAEQAESLSRLRMERAQYGSQNAANQLRRQELILGMIAPQVQQQMLMDQMGYRSQFDNPADAAQYYGRDPEGRARVDFAHGQYIVENKPGYIKTWKSGDDYTKMLQEFNTLAAQIGPFQAAAQIGAEFENPGLASVILYEYMNSVAQAGGGGGEG
jgi:hypothetical protein